MLTVAARLLGDAERESVERLLDEDPYGGAQVAERVAMAGLAWWRQDARVFGYGSRRQLESLCWLGANLIPVSATPSAVQAFADLVRGEPRGCSSIVGSADAVLGLWNQLGAQWGRARDVRPSQPLLATTTAPAMAADPGVRLVRPDELQVLFPAAVAMYTEEVGVSPTADGGERSYRERVSDLIKGRRAYAKIVDGRVVFKAELAVVTKHTAQVQGVWTAPELRGKGIATACMAGVVQDALRRIAPSVSLYVNDYNEPARRVYERCGFRQVGLFATVLF
jgi:predicted GNAT family acetyltransferase